MVKRVKLKGKVVSGAREASFFTQLDWVQTQCLDKLGFRPYPGTFNLRVDTDDRLSAKKLRGIRGMRLVPDDPEFCAATVIPARLGAIKGAVVVPSEEVNIHGEEIIEILAPVNLRKALGVQDGDKVALEIDVDCLNKT